MAATAAEVVSAISADACLDSAFRGGKMLGILIHSQGWEVAYSGKRIASVSSVSVRGEVKDFVPPVYDVTVGPFREKEEEISAMNQAVSEALAQGREEDAAALKLQRAMESVRLQKWTFSQYVVHNALGESLSVLDIFARKGVLPPASAGDCAAPKLLEYAFRHGLEPLEIGEFWYGASPFGPVRAQGRFYPSCSWKCGPVLGYMLQGLTLDSVSPQAAPTAAPVAAPSAAPAAAPASAPTSAPASALAVSSASGLAAAPEIIFEDDSVIVVDKPSGMPAVSGLDGRLSLEELLIRRQCQEPSGPAASRPQPDHLQFRDSAAGIFQVHRLDQDTSGLIVFAKTRQAQAALRRQFEERQVEKTYLALLLTSPDHLSDHSDSGEIDLPLAPDYEDKPRQKVDMTQGKKAVTAYRLLYGHDAESVLDFFRGSVPDGTGVCLTGDVCSTVRNSMSDHPHADFAAEPFAESSAAFAAESSDKLCSSTNATSNSDTSSQLVSSDLHVAEVQAVLLHPYTGRSHQLRVHAAHFRGLGSPILGDTLYGGAQEYASVRLLIKPFSPLPSSPSTLSAQPSPSILSVQPASAFNPEWECSQLFSRIGTMACRLCLHASSLSFIHPSTGRIMTFSSGPTIK